MSRRPAPTPPSGVPAAQIQLDGIRLVEASIQRNLSFGDDEELPALTLEFDFQRTFPDKESAILSARLDINRDNAEAPFRLSITYELRASIESGGNASVLQGFAKHNAVSALIPYFRESVANITTRMGFPALVLPPLNAQALVEHSEQQGSRTKR